MSVCDSVVVSLQNSNSTMLDTSCMTAAHPVKFHTFGPIFLNRRLWRSLPLYMLMLPLITSLLRRGFDNSSEFLQFSVVLRGIAERNLCQQTRPNIQLTGRREIINFQYCTTNYSLYYTTCF